MALPKKGPAYERIWWRIGDVAKMFGCNQSLLRYYEKEFEILQPRKNSKGTRNFTKEDITNLKLIFYYLRERGYTIDGAKAKLKDNKTDALNNMEMYESLTKVREFLLQIKKESEESIEE